MDYLDLIDVNNISYRSDVYGIYRNDKRINISTTCI